MEIGSLASATNGASVFLFVAMAAYLRQRGFTYAVATVTRALRRSFALFGLDSLELCAADPASLPDSGVSWGTYYVQEPKVVAGAITHGFDRLQPFLRALRNDDRAGLLTALPNVRTALQ